MAITYQASDLAQKRRAFINDARAGVARLRDTDGLSLVMLPEDRYSVLEELARWSRCHLALGRALRIAEGERHVADFGEFSWLRVFDGEDLEEFRAEFEEALHVALAERSLDVIQAVVDDWRTTAQALNDPLRRDVLLGSPADDEFVEAGPPMAESPTSTPTR